MIGDAVNTSHAMSDADATPVVASILCNNWYRMWANVIRSLTVAHHQMKPILLFYPPGFLSLFALLTACVLTRADASSQAARRVYWARTDT